MPPNERNQRGIFFIVIKAESVKATQPEKIKNAAATPPKKIEKVYSVPLYNIESH